MNAKRGLDDLIKARNTIYDACGDLSIFFFREKEVLSNGPADRKFFDLMTKIQKGIELSMDAFAEFTNYPEFEELLVNPEIEEALYEADICSRVFTNKWKDLVYSYRDILKEAADLSLASAGSLVQTIGKSNFEKIIEKIDQYGDHLTKSIKIIEELMEED